MTITQNYAVTGMTCGHCVSSVAEEISALPGVAVVTVDLQPEGASTVSVTSETALTDAQVDAALNEAGDYHRAAQPVTP
jgi:copper chaperone CopZ